MLAPRLGRRKKTPQPPEGDQRRAIPGNVFRPGRAGFGRPWGNLREKSGQDCPFEGRRLAARAANLGRFFGQGWAFPRPIRRNPSPETGNLVHDGGQGQSAPACRRPPELLPEGDLMTTTRPRRAAALLLAATLVLAAVPATAAPPAEGAGEAWSATRLVDTLAGWLAALWPGAAPDGAPAAAWAQLGPTLDPNGEPTGETQVGSEGDSDDEPTAEPQLGPGLDPAG